ncbi:MAG TPA: phytanoyl-CoA dioxygenase [Cyclobacteriaceae bacterium]|nr:phytanoyl-CoA dioxygenase [Cyclobacteriaceae bacterium]
MGILNDDQINQFISDGYVKVENAFSKELAEEALRILWKDTGCDPNNSSTWTRPVIRLGEYAQAPFRQIANTPLLHSAFDQLVGRGRWLPRGSLGTFPVRFPSSEKPNDTGWHVESSFPGVLNDYSTWRINVRSKGRALLMLFLFSDVSKSDAPTRIRIGSHLEVANLLKPFGESGLSFMELAKKLDATSHRDEVLAAGDAGTVFLCHPFLVHAAQPHIGRTPRFMAQPPLLPAEDFQLHRDDGSYSPVEIAIRTGITL